MAKRILPCLEIRVADEERLGRLRSAIKLGGGNQAVARRSGVPLGTLNNYLAGRDMKVSALVAISEACGVSTEWLASGHGEMRHEAMSQGSYAKSSTLVEGDVKGAKVPRIVTTNYDALFSTLDIDRFALCLDLVQSAFKRMNLVPPPRRLVQLTVLLYDAWDDGSFATSGLDDLVAGKEN